MNLLKFIYQNIWVSSSLISSKEIVLPAVAFGIFQIKTTMLIKPQDLFCSYF